MTHRIALIEPYLRGNEAAYLRECIETNYVSSVGPFVSRFEEAFAKVTSCRHAIACGSGTAALHVAMQVSGVGPGDRIPVPTLTFIASANAVAYTGAAVLLVDSEPLTWNMDAERLYDFIVHQAAGGVTPPPAIEIVHILGQPAAIEPLLALKERFGIRLVEDAAESLGAYYHGIAGERMPVGSAGDIACFSLNGNKIITAGAGGVIVTDNQTMAERARHLTTQARIPGRAYNHDEVGYNYRMSNVHAALGLAQLEQLEQFLERKRAIADRYDDMLADTVGVTLPPRLVGTTSSRWLYSILCPSEEVRDRALEGADVAGIELRPLWVPLHLQAPYRHAERLGGEFASDLSRCGLSLPCSVGLTLQDQCRVVEFLQTALV